MDKKIHMRSRNRLLGLDAEVMIMSHHFQLFGESTLAGKEPGEMMRASIKIADRL
jgi:hypothetical protein